MTRKKKTRPEKMLVENKHNQKKTDKKKKAGKIKHDKKNDSF